MFSLLLLLSVAIRICHKNKDGLLEECGRLVKSSYVTQQRMRMTQADLPNKLKYMNEPS
jgi:hypothetical protein